MVSDEELYLLACDEFVVYFLHVFFPIMACDLEYHSNDGSHTFIDKCFQPVLSIVCFLILHFDVCYMTRQG
jgi:hypothetical protein